jgi:hypothetical protein
MSAWTDARDNITEGFVSAWDSMTPVTRAVIIGFVAGLVVGLFLAWVF